ncbi:nicotinate phosphoribosyltransferase [Phormidesmis priestleyi ULC007]|uniref:Nicotinate phosphoribosyltransferase n=1 Tax=Phormidesmis priestleyi ULC007 TaxID=1920490 RepID=A0A2T1DLW3_9CYAN|nr:nicotinate phosphoribosyltransferase [Phormidesmis priestleyi]PSB21462.1 nicotinate phosphoribosyltransferase [Phormidesmis priestleyi ULC007]PZO46704.1 MAG: nicotinate phosphoribosyltransferase [Phormidesmis priestleyi]
MEDIELTLTPDDYSLLTDLYQLTMAACYVGEHLDQRRASFEMTVRRLPERFGYLIAMGLAQALDYLEKFRFSSTQVEALQSMGAFEHAPTQFWAVLQEARFSGDVWAVPEGTAIFANEPLLRIEAPLWQAQLVETYLLNTLNYQTLVATRSARMRDVAGVDATLLEFGTRRAFSPQGALWAARAALAAGLDATSNVLAAVKLGRTPSGTMAHALVMALSATEGTEAEAFTAFHRYFPGAPLLIDTYDTIAAARDLSEQMKAGLQLSGVRIDSGDLASLSQQVRSLLPGVAIIASGDLDEWKIAELKAAGACINGYGIGTQLVTGSPVNGVYKLVEIDGIPVMKESPGKITHPGRKQIFRRVENGIVQCDRLGLIHETPDHEQPLMQLVFKQGQRVQESDSLSTIAERTIASVASLSASVRDIDQPESIPLDLSDDLSALIKKTRRKTTD